MVGAVDGIRSLAVPLAIISGESYFWRTVNEPSDLAALRKEYSAHGLNRRDLDPDPVKQFGIWFTAAVEAGISEVNAMTLATVSSNHRPSARVVLLKGYSHDGFVFYTNYGSEKGQHLAKNAHAALVLHWKELERQIRIDGTVKKNSREESKRYFHSRPVGAQLGAWVSHQSEVIDARRILEARLAEMEERFAGKEIPLPPNWGGYIVQPERIEFWQGRANRLHDRFRYTREGNGWQLDRLAP
jgi:pyridoxamine 5'-phosphate oxidase